MSEALDAGYEEDIVMTGEAVALELRPTPFVLAAAGAAIDWVVYVVGGILVIAFGVIIPLGASSWGDDSAVLSIFVSVSIVLFFVVIPTAVELLTKGKSLGRLAVGARIVRDDGGPIGFRHAFIRSLTAVIELYIFAGFAAIFGLLNSRSKRAGDMLAGTYSLYERVPQVAYPVFDVPVSLQDWALTADVARIPNRVALRATRFLRQTQQLSPTSRAAIAHQLAVELSRWVSPIPGTEPELFVAAVVAVRRDRELRARELEAERLALVQPTLDALPHGFPVR